MIVARIPGDDLDLELRANHVIGEAIEQAVHERIVHRKIARLPNQLKAVRRIKRCVARDRAGPRRVFTQPGYPRAFISEGMPPFAIERIQKRALRSENAQNAIETPLDPRRRIRLVPVFPKIFCEHLR